MPKDPVMFLAHSKETLNTLSTLKYLSIFYRHISQTYIYVEKSVDFHAVSTDNRNIDRLYPYIMKF